jgi:hypothetical protein
MRHDFEVNELIAMAERRTVEKILTRDDIATIV